ncbi:MAG: hypothetical protein V7K38_24085 [Nostoc sp.]
MITNSLKDLPKESVSPNPEINKKVMLRYFGLRVEKSASLF